MTGGQEANAAERRRWNDEHWASAWPKREQMTNAVTDILLGHVGLVAGESVVDIGSGGGTATMAAARLVGGGGRAVGADISAPLVAFARQRARDRGVANVSFAVVDAQRDVIPEAPFDAAISQFGVMFFDEPAAAFHNIRGHLVASGRLGFACWQSVERNPWFVGPALVPYISPPPPPAPGKSPTGPFSFSDPARVAAILAEAGWTDVQRSPHEVVVGVDREAIIDDEQLTFLGVAESALTDARRAVDDHLADLIDGDGRIQAPLAFQIFTAAA